MSFFNVFSHDPPIVVLGIQPRLSGEDKDTVVNIRRTGEFVVNMVDMELSQQMLICGLGFEAGLSVVILAMYLDRVTSAFADTTPHRWTRKTANR